MKSLSFLLAAALLLFPMLAHAELRLPAIVGDNMVLQQNADAPVWGWSQPGQKVTLTLNKQTASAIADDKGKWIAHFKDLKPGGPFELLIEADSTLTLKNVLVGEVWLCSGQSNMQANMGWVAGKEECAQADCPEIHLFLTRISLAPKPLEDTQGQWVVCTPKTVGPFPAVGYYFGREIQQARQVPVGLIGSASGGSTAQTWMSAEAFANNEKLGGPADLADPGIKKFYQRLADYDQAYAEWKKLADEAKAQKKRPTIQPLSPLRGYGYPPSGTYNAMLAPLLPYGLRGTIWYQGEANTFVPGNYAKVMHALITDWRKGFHNPDMPFLFVQLPNYIPDNVAPGNWARLREQQLLTLIQTPHTAMAVTIDVGNPKDIHPRNKKPVGHRLALAALKTVYGQDLVSSGPLFDSVTFDSSRAHLTFREVGSGLCTSDGQDPKGFTIAGEDKNFLAASAKIEGHAVIVWNDQVKTPTAIRYAFSDNPNCTLQNKEGLPASPFRTDAADRE